MNSIMTLVELNELDLELVAGGKLPNSKTEGVNRFLKPGIANELNPQPLPPGGGGRVRGGSAVR